MVAHSSGYNVEAVASDRGAAARGPPIAAELVYVPPTDPVELQALLDEAERYYAPLSCDDADLSEIHVVRVHLRRRARADRSRSRG